MGFNSGFKRLSRTKSSRKSSFFWSVYSFSYRYQYYEYRMQYLYWYQTIFINTMPVKTFDFVLTFLPWIAARRLSNI